MAFKKSKQKSQPDLFATASLTSCRGTTSSIAMYC